MKRIITTISALLLMMTAHLNASAQVDPALFETVMDFLDESQSQTLVRLQEDISRGDKLIVQADSEDNKNKFLGSDKKGKQKKGEKKSVPAKGVRIKAIKYYEKSYASLIEIYKDVVEEGTFEFMADKSAADDFIGQAEETLDEASQKLAPYNKLNEKSLETTNYAKLKSDMSACKQKFEYAANQGYEAIKLLAAQQEKKQKEDAAEQTFWNNAVNTNTIDSYNRYISKYPTGKYVNDARRRIANLQQMAMVKKPMSDDVNEGLCYRIQILADEKPWNARKLQRLYKGNLTIDERQSDGYYKYWVGCYRTYDEAQAAEQSMRLKQSFIVCFNNGRQIHVTEAQEIESKYDE